VFERLREGLKGLVEKIAVTELRAEKIQPILSELELTLVENDVALPVAERICEELAKRLEGVKVKRLGSRREIVREHLRQILLEILTTKEEVDLIRGVEAKKRQGQPYVILFLGVNGTGKTTTIAKIAHLLKQKGYSIVLACSDTYRAGAIEQLEEHAKRLGVRMIRHRYGSDPAAVAYDAVEHARARGVNVVLIDTAGRMQTNRNLMNEMVKIKRVINPDLTILVVDALTGNDAAVQAEEFHESVGIDGTILTKVDADVKGGAALSVTYASGKPILFVGTGQRYEDLERFDPERFAQMILH